MVEMVVYVAVLVLMLVIVTGVVVSVSRSQRLLASSRNINDSGIALLERVQREVRGADSIDTDNSILGVNPGKLVLVSATTTWEFYLTSGRVRLKKNGADVGALTGASTTVTSLIFSRFSSGEFEGIRTRLTLESGTTTSFRSETFYSSALIR